MLYLSILSNLYNTTAHFLTTLIKKAFDVKTRGENAAFHIPFSVLSKIEIINKITFILWSAVVIWLEVTMDLN